LEKSTHEKQDAIVALQKQLEEMKSADLKMQTQLQGVKETHGKDSLKIRSLEGSWPSSQPTARRLRRTSMRHAML